MENYNKYQEEQKKLSKTNEQFLMEKISNFVRYVDGLSTHKKVPELQKTRDYIIGAKTDDIVFYIIHEIYPHKNDFVSYIKNLFAKYNIDISLFEKEELTKFKRYLACFVEVCTS